MTENTQYLEEGWGRNIEETPAEKQFRLQRLSVNSHELTFEEKDKSLAAAYKIVNLSSLKMFLAIPYGLVLIISGVALMKLIEPFMGWLSVAFLLVSLKGFMYLLLFTVSRILVFKNWQDKVFIMEDGLAVHRYTKDFGMSQATITVRPMNGFLKADPIPTKK